MRKSAPRQLELLVFKEPPAFIGGSESLPRLRSATVDCVWVLEWSAAAHSPLPKVGFKSLCWRGAPFLSIAHLDVRLNHNLPCSNLQN